VSIQDKWERNQKAFEVLSKKEFDILYNEKRFVEGPLVSKSSKWGLEFGPYNPHRWAFGELNDGRLVCCDTAAETAGGET
jgi:hypothetical protein